MKFNAKAPEAIEVDFERKIQISNPEAKIYALEEDTVKVASGSHPMPLTLRVNVGDCVKVNLKNKMKDGKALLLRNRVGVRSEGFDGRQCR